MPSKRKTEFWWASIHGADPEPVEKAVHEGRPCVYTLGCGDPFYLDEPGIEFVSWLDGGIDLKSNHAGRSAARTRTRPGS